MSKTHDTSHTRIFNPSAALLLCCLCCSPSKPLSLVPCTLRILRCCCPNTLSASSRHRLADPHRRSLRRLGTAIVIESSSTAASAYNNTPPAPFLSLCRLVLCRVRHFYHRLKFGASKFTSCPLPTLLSRPESPYPRLPGMSTTNHSMRAYIHARLHAAAGPTGSPANSPWLASPQDSASSAPS